MGKINVLFEQNYNQISVKKKDNENFKKNLESFLSKWGKIVELFDGRFLYVKESSKETTYYFFQDQGEEIEISSSEYMSFDDKSPSFARSFIRFICKAEDNDDAYEYSFGLKPFEKEFYSDLYNLTNKFGEISFIGEVTTLDVSGCWDATYDLVKDGVAVDALYRD